jgi:hypothetical protein
MADLQHLSDATTACFRLCLEVLWPIPPHSANTTVAGTARCVLDVVLVVIVDKPIGWMARVFQTVW